MEKISYSETLIERLAELKEKYGDKYPIILYEPALKCQGKKDLRDLVEGNNSLHLFTEFREAFKFAQSFGISFLLIISKYFDEQHVLKNFGSVEYTFGRKMLDFEEEALLKHLFKGTSDEKIKSLNLKAYVFCQVFDCVTEAEVKEDEEEVMLMCDIKDIVKEFRQNFEIILYDPSMSAESKTELEKKIEVKIQEKNIYKDFQKLSARIKDDTSIPYHLILSGEIKSEAQELVKDFKNLKDILGLYIISEHDLDIPIEKIFVKKTIEELIPQIKKGIRTLSKLKNSFPAFATNFGSPDRSGIYKLHYFLRGLINFKNRKQAKEDFIKLARKIYQDEDKELKRFEDKYNEYNKEEILKWYTKESPIYRLINNCLRISSSDSILCCRFVLKDLEKAIIEQYQEKSKGFNGVVYRGTFISKEEWKKLNDNIGQEIEMYGFLSTSVNRKTAVRFLRPDPKNKILIKIIIPSLPEFDEQGFAEIGEFSEFQEEEILFNVRSKFKILEADISKIDHRGTQCRQLVLLYGAESLRKYMTKHKPSIEIKLELPSEVNCNLCGSKDKLFGFKQQEKTSVTCLECLIKISLPKDTPLIALEGEKDKLIQQKFPGENSHF